MKLPTYITIKELHVVNKRFGENVLPSGSFVQPLDPAYLPAHVRDSIMYRCFNPEVEIFCYTHYGIVTLPKNKVRRIYE